MVITNVILGIILWNLMVSSITYKLKLKKDKLYCGMVGFSGNNNFNTEKIRLLLLYNSLTRGEDATGIYSPNNGLIKHIEAGYNLLNDNKFIINPDKILMGHVRAKTVGVNSVENTHPFQRGNWYLQHNGTLTNHYLLLGKYKLNFNNFNVDSDIVAGCIEKSNNLDVLKEISGPGAFIIHNNLNPEELIVFRNKERPLYKGFIDGDMYISSISQSLKYIGCINIKEFKEDVVYYISKGLITKSYKISNKPYYEHTTTTNVVNYNGGILEDNDVINLAGSNVYIQVSNLKNSNIRAINYFTYGTKSLIKGKYYKIKTVYKNKWINVVNEDNVMDEFYITNFNLNDIIYKGNIVKSIYNIVDTNNKKKTLLQINVPVEVSEINDDGTITLCKIGDNETVITRARKEYFIKLTEDELSLLNNGPLLITPIKNDELPFVEDNTSNQDNGVNYNDVDCLKVCEDNDTLLENLTNILSFYLNDFKFTDGVEIEKLIRDLKDNNVIIKNNLVELT